MLSGWAGGSAGRRAPRARITDVQTNRVHYFQRPDAKQLQRGLDRHLARRLRRAGVAEQGKGQLDQQLGDRACCRPGSTSTISASRRTPTGSTAHAGLGYKWTEPTKNVKNHMVLGAVFASADFDGNITSEGVWGRAFWWFTNNWTLNPSFAYNPRDREPAPQPRRPADAERAGLSSSTSAATPTAAASATTASTTTSTCSRPKIRSRTASIRSSPTSRARTCASISGRATRCRATARSTSTRWLIPPPPPRTARATCSRGSTSRPSSINVRLNVSFTPDVSLQFFGQPLISSGRYSDFRELARPQEPRLHRPGRRRVDVRSRSTRSLRPRRRRPRRRRSEGLQLQVAARQRGVPLGVPPGLGVLPGVDAAARRRREHPRFHFSGLDASRMFSADASNIFLAKVTYYLGL